MLVDDDVNILEYYKSVIEENGLESIQCTNGKEAFNQFLKFKNQIKLILIDYELPDITGVQVIQQIRNIKEGTQVPIIICSGNYSSYHEEQANSVGALFISKPISAMNIIEIIEQYEL